MPTKPTEYDDLKRLEADLIAKYGEQLGVINHRQLFTKGLARPSETAFGPFVQYPHRQFNPLIQQLDGWLKARLQPEDYKEVDSFIAALRERHAQEGRDDYNEYVGSPSSIPAINAMNTFLNTVPFNEKFDKLKRAGTLSIRIFIRVTNNVPHPMNVRQLPPHSSIALLDTSNGTFDFYATTIKQIFLKELVATAEESKKYEEKFDTHWAAIAQAREKHKEMKKLSDAQNRR